MESDSKQQQYQHQHQTTAAADAEFLSELSGTTTSTSASSSSVTDLHKTNLLRLQMDELVAASKVDYMHVKWHKAAQDYVTAVAAIIEKLPLHDVPQLWNPHDPTCPFVRLGDKVPTIIPKQSSSSKSRLRCKPTGCFQAEGLGMLTAASNAKVLPTLDLRVSIPTTEIVEAKDYLKHRYIDVSTVLVCIVSLLHSVCVRA